MKKRRVIATSIGVRATLILALVAAGLTRAELPTQDDDGGLSITVSFDYATLLQSGFLEAGAFTEQRYCDLFERASHHLWQVSEGQHWIRRVDFFLGMRDTHINWDFVPERKTSYGSHRNAIILHENYGRDFSPVEMPPPTPQELRDYFDDRHAWLVTHELGHFLYGLSDEYIHGRERKGSLGLCSGLTSGTCSGDPSRLCVGNSDCEDPDTCDGESARESCVDDTQCMPNETCIKREIRNGVQGPKICADYEDDGSDPNAFTECSQGCPIDPDTNQPYPCNDETVLFRCAGVGNDVKYCFEDADCQQNGDEGWCVREFERGEPPYRNICRDREAPFPPPAEVDEPDCPYRSGEPSCFRNRTSNMSGSGSGGRWCDETTHLTKRQIVRGEGGSFEETGSGNDPLYPLLIQGGYIHTWYRAARRDLAINHKDIDWPNLRTYYDLRVDYPLWVDLEFDDFRGAVDWDDTWPADCNWNIDAPLPLPGDNTIVILDQTGSMNFPVGNSGKTAFEYAAEAALAILEETPDSNWVGINVSTDLFGNYQPPIVAYQSKAAIDLSGIDDLYDEFFDNFVPDDNIENLAGSIKNAVLDFEAAGPGAPTGGRNIMLITDWLVDLADTFAARQEAMDACDKGITVNTVIVGQFASPAPWVPFEIVDYCAGVAVNAATEDVQPEGFDAHLLKAAMMDTRNQVTGLDKIPIVDPHSSLSDNEDVSTRVFFVHADSGPLTFTWVGNEVRYCVVDGGGKGCLEFSDSWSEMTFSLLNPSQQQVVPGTVGKSFYAVAEVAQPEAGFWTARADASAVPTAGDTREETRISWLAHVDDNDLVARAWVEYPKRGLDDPVLINAQLYFEAPLTEISVAAQVSKDGVIYGAFPLHDDGGHGDGDAGDSIYGGWFNPDGNFFTTVGPYAVEVLFISLEGTAKPVVEEDVEEGDLLAPVEPGDGNVSAETFFYLDPRYDCDVPAIDCGDPGDFILPIGTLTQGSGTMPSVFATVTDLPLVDDRVAVDLGPGVRAESVRVLGGGPPPPGGGGGGGNLAFDVFIDNEARIGTHTASVWVGGEKLTTEFQVVCSPLLDPSAPLIEAPRTTLTVCGAAGEVLLPLPLVTDECTPTAPVDLTGAIVTINGETQVPPIPIDTAGTGGPAATLPLGYTLVEWQASDVHGNSRTRKQRIDVELDPACTAAGVVPDGSLGSTPLRVDPVLGGELRLSWSASCSATDLDYEIYEGTLGDFTSHTPAVCSTGGATVWTLPDPPGDRYYLVVPRTPLREGSYGRDSSNQERPQGLPPCLLQESGACGGPAQ